MQISATFSRRQSNGNGAHGTPFDQFPAPAPGPIASFAKSLRSLTNYEVRRQAESAFMQLPSDQDSEPQDWWRVRALLEELQWRQSGLEGAGSPTPQLPVTLWTGPEQ